MTESIYNLIPRPPDKVVSAATYRSRFPGNLPPSGSTFGATTASQTIVTNLSGSIEGPTVTHPYRKLSATFGQIKTPKQHPGMFLKKGTGFDDLPKASKYTYPDETKKPAVISKDEKPVMGLVTTKNFIKTNAVANILQEPGPRNETPSGKPALHAEYGEVPDYLQHVKNEIQEEYAYILEMQEQENQYRQVSDEANVKLLSKVDQTQLLEKLKKKWDHVNQIYQKHTHEVVLDTVGKLRRKEQCEAELQQIEKDIEKLSKEYVFIKST
eukprot:97359_1